MDFVWKAVFYFCGGFAKPMHIWKIWEPGLRWILWPFSAVPLYVRRWWLCSPSPQRLARRGLRVAFCPSSPPVPAASLPHQSSCPASITHGPTTVCLLSSPARATLVSGLCATACWVALTLTPRVAECKPSPRPRPSRKRTPATHSPRSHIRRWPLAPLTQPSCFLQFCFLTETASFLN